MTGEKPFKEMTARHLMERFGRKVKLTGVYKRLKVKSIRLAIPERRLFARS